MPFPLYHHVISHSLHHFPKWYWNAWKAVARKVVETWEGAVASNPIGRSDEVMSSWVYGSEGKKESEGQSKGGGWEKKGCRREEEEEENVGVSPTTPGQGTRGRHHPFGGHWKIPDHRT